MYSDELFTEWSLMVTYGEHWNVELKRSKFQGFKATIATLRVGG